MKGVKERSDERDGKRKGLLPVGGGFMAIYESYIVEKL